MSGHMPETQNWPPGGQAHKKFPFLISFYFILLIFWHFDTIVIFFKNKYFSAFIITKKWNP